MLPWQPGPLPSHGGILFFCTAHLPNERVSSSGVCLLPLPSNWLLGCHSFHVNATWRVCGYLGSWNVVSGPGHQPLPIMLFINRICFTGNDNHWLLCHVSPTAGIYQVINGIDIMERMYWMTKHCVKRLQFCSMALREGRQLFWEQLKTGEYHKLFYWRYFPSTDDVWCNDICSKAKWQRCLLPAKQWMWRTSRISWETDCY